ncbi:SRPBCC family protein [Pelagibacterium luteolum]|uniref:Activator of Hsp90 ATPase homolog 1-like protein n=1 Tax=Pelagibacterium luteolum TaxID=440168 RepID=A0A1G7UUG8_9HYPH|nr:SRPBCC family protein [Pelagibacterium luteolum]SDG51182.1 Activator of Hsp90 ATPase homolog 1-like protein [Pelagibacterium luteolum]
MPNVTARTEHRFSNHSAEQVHKAWLDPDMVRAWMTRNVQTRAPSAQVTRIEIDPRVGGRYFFESVEEGEASPGWGNYRAIEPGRVLVFTWFVTPEEEDEDNSTVTLTLSPSGNGCVATMTHEMDEEWADYIEPTAKAWNGMLKAIEATI